MKKTIFRICLLILALGLVFSLSTGAAASENGSFNASLNIDSQEDRITVTVDNSDSNNLVLAAQRPTLSIPCTFENAYVIHNDVLIASTLENGKISFTVSDGGDYIIYSGTASAPNELTFSGASVTLYHNLAINFKVNAELFGEGGYADPYVEFVWNGKTYTVQDYTVSEGKYVFSFRNIAPNQMNDSITAILHATYQGTEYTSHPKVYSVATYCYNNLETYSSEEYAKLRTLLVDILNYGSVSQQYTGYNADNLANEMLTDAQKTWGTAGDPQLSTVRNIEYKTVANPTATWKAAGLVLNDAVSLRMKFSADSIDGLYLKVTTDSEQEWTVAANRFVPTEGGYYVYFNGLHAGQMKQTLYLTLYKDDTPVSHTIRYSIESYAYEKQNSTIPYLADLVKAMMHYGNSAYAFNN